MTDATETAVGRKASTPEDKTVSSGSSQTRKATRISMSSSSNRSTSDQTVSSTADDNLMWAARTGFLAIPVDDRTHGSRMRRVDIELDLHVMHLLFITERAATKICTHLPFGRQFKQEGRVAICRK